jgi:hypothetical protein
VTKSNWNVLAIAILPFFKWVKCITSYFIGWQCFHILQ